MKQNERSLISRRVPIRWPSQARKVANDMREKARGTYEDARHRASDAYAQGREQIRSFESDVEKYVREKPLTSVMIALGAGFVIGWAIRH